ncbi:hypothetical protein HGRIS_005186 [Hohenbuehelia grisea]|uniref:DEK C-terminal domain-containing protein n=1 Tax=Hohenbuehelia grisea TaxID=104357 RepID=A0ABR3JF44_9AGAR
MSTPGLLTLQNSAKEIVRDGKRTNTLHELTVRVICKKLEEQFGLESGSLKEHKSSIKSAITAAVEEEATEERAVTPQVAAVPDGPSTPAKIARKRKSVDAKGGAEKKPRKASPASAAALSPIRFPSSPPPDSPSKGARARRKRQGPEPQRYKSAMFVDSDIEEDETQPEPLATKPKKAVSAPAIAKGPAKKPKAKEIKPEIDPTPTAPAADLKPPLAKEPSGPITKKPAPRGKGETKEKAKIVKHETSEAEAETKAEASDSALSSLFDDDPKPKKSKATTKGGTTRKPRERKSAGEKLSKDDETIKRLKGIVSACGVRKQWAKVFDGLDKPSQQIAKLKSTLNELGMTGRFSLEKAKAIKAERELAKELEDVQSFEKAVIAAPSRTRRQSRSTAKVAETDDEDEDQGSQSEDERPTRRRLNARAKILAFLADQSDDD